METSYQIRLMPEFYGVEIDHDTKAYRIVRIEDNSANGVSDVKEYVHEENLTRGEINRKIYKLDPNATLLD